MTARAASVSKAMKNRAVLMPLGGSVPRSSFTTPCEMRLHALLAPPISNWLPALISTTTA